MGIFQRFRREMRAGNTAQSEDPILSAMLGGNVSRDIALQIPAIAGGIDLIANLIAETPIKLYRDGDGRAKEVRDDPRLRLLNDETGDTLNANEFWRAIVRDYYLGKGGYAFIAKNGLKIVGLHYVQESKILTQENQDPIFKEYDIFVEGRRYAPDNFFKILRNTRDGMRGVSIVEENPQLIEVAYQSLKLEGATVKKGGMKRGFIKSPRQLGDEAMKTLKRTYQDLYTNDSDRVMVLNGGLDFKEISSTAVEMQLRELKEANATEVARILHISPQAMSGNATRSDIESLARLAAIPLMKVIECALNRDLLLESEKGSMYYAFDTKELLKGDIAARFAAYKTALDGNFMQIDEVRYEEDLEPLGLTWIKLGLNDVLYDPKTKLIYTPNTDKTAQMGEKSLPGPEDTNILEARARYTKGKDGKFTGSIGDGRDYAEGDYKNIRIGSDDNTERTEVGGFEGKSKAQKHSKKHGGEFDAKNEKAYKESAVEFLSKPLKGSMDEMTTDDGHRYRYDWKTNEYGAVNTRGNVPTYFKPKEGSEYWKDKVNEHGRK